MTAPDLPPPLPAAAPAPPRRERFGPVRSSPTPRGASAAPRSARNAGAGGPDGDARLLAARSPVMSSADLYRLDALKDKSALRSRFPRARGANPAVSARSDSAAAGRPFAPYPFGSTPANARRPDASDVGYGSPCVQRGGVLHRDVQPAYVSTYSQAAAFPCSGPAACVVPSPRFQELCTPIAPGPVYYQPLPESPGFLRYSAKTAFRTLESPLWPVSCCPSPASFRQQPHQSTPCVYVGGAQRAASCRPPFPASAWADTVPEGQRPFRRGPDKPRKTQREHSKSNSSKRAGGSETDDHRCKSECTPRSAGGDHSLISPSWRLTETEMEDMEAAAAPFEPGGQQPEGPARLHILQARADAKPPIEAKAEHYELDRADEGKGARAAHEDNLTAELATPLRAQISATPPDEDHPMAEATLPDEDILMADAALSSEGRLTADAAATSAASPNVSAEKEAEGNTYQKSSERAKPVQNEEPRALAAESSFGTGGNGEDNENMSDGNPTPDDEVGVEATADLNDYAAHKLSPGISCRADDQPAGIMQAPASATFPSQSTILPPEAFAPSSTSDTGTAISQGGSTGTTEVGTEAGLSKVDICELAPPDGAPAATGARQVSGKGAKVTDTLPAPTTPKRIDRPATFSSTITRSGRASVKPGAWWAAKRTEPAGDQSNRGRPKKDQKGKGKAQVFADLPAVTKDARKRKSKANDNAPKKIRGTKAETNGTKPETNPSRKETRITGGVGTLVRTRQMREALAKRNEGHQDDIFDSAEFAISGTQGPDVVNTPADHIRLRDPMFTSSSGRSSGSPEILKPLDVKAKEAYVHVLKQRRMLASRCGNEGKQQRGRAGPLTRKKAAAAAAAADKDLAGALAGQRPELFRRAFDASSDDDGPVITGFSDELD